MFSVIALPVWSATNETASLLSPPPFPYFVCCDLECLPIKLSTLWQVSVSASGSWCTKIMNQLLPLSTIQRYDNSGLRVCSWETHKPRGKDCRLQQKGKLMQKEVTVCFPCRGGSGGLLWRWDAIEYIQQELSSSFLRCAAEHLRNSIYIN